MIEYNSSAEDSAEKICKLLLKRKIQEQVGQASEQLASLKSS